MHARNMATHSQHSVKIDFIVSHNLGCTAPTYIKYPCIIYYVYILYSEYTFNSDMIHIQIGRVTSQNCIAWLAHAAATATQPEKISRPILSYSATCKLCLPHLPPIPSYSGRIPSCSISPQVQAGSVHGNREKATLEKAHGGPWTYRCYRLPVFTAPTHLG